MDKLKVYQKIYQLPEFTRNFMDVNIFQYLGKLNTYVFVTWHCVYENIFLRNFFASILGLVYEIF